MASKRFSKNTEEFMMFQDFWQLCQKYWEPEDNDEYWESVIADAGVFTKKYHDGIFPMEIAKAFLTSLELRMKKISDT
jgi:thymidylate kinase